MGLSTFIEINNDFTDRIGENPGEFVGEILVFLHSGQYKKLPPGVMRMVTFHRDYKECQKIQKIMERN